MSAKGAIFYGLIAFACTALVAGEAAENAPAVPAAVKNDAEWQKLETKFAPLPQLKQILSAGLFDSELQKTITFTKDGTPADTGLPHFGKDKNGKEYPAIMARFSQNAIWVDFNGDGKPQADEMRPLSPEGLTEPFTCELHYEDGSSSQYSFRLKEIVENEKFALIRACARTVEFQNQKLVLLDDNGNGKYDDIDKDSLMIGDGPVSFLGKYVRLGNAFYEILSHESGTVVEIRPAPKQGLSFGTVDMFAKYKPSQKSENLKIHTLIVSGPEGSFAFDDKHHSAPVPAGAYDIVFGLFERAKETVYLKKGEKTSFTVPADGTAAPAWGGDVKAKFEIKQDVPPEPKPGTKPVELKPDKQDDKNKPEIHNLWVGPPSFVGIGSEKYFPENFRNVPVQAAVARTYTLRGVETREPLAGKRFEVQPDGSVKGAVFKVMAQSYEYECTITYSSGILGSVDGHEHYSYVAKKKLNEKKP